MIDQQWTDLAAVLSDESERMGHDPSIARALRSPWQEWVGQWIVIYAANFIWTGIAERITESEIVLRHVHQVYDVEDLETRGLPEVLSGLSKCGYDAEWATMSRSRSWSRSWSWSQ